MFILNRKNMLVVFVVVGIGWSVFGWTQNAWAATLLSNVGEANDKGDGVFRSNIWVANKFTAGAAATITSVTLNLEETAGNYTGFSTYTSGVIRFYEDNSGVVGDAISGTLSYTSTNTGTGHTVYANASGTITLPAAGSYWIAFTCASCANVDYEETSSTSYSGEAGWATIVADSTVSSSGNGGSTWGTPYSSATFGAAMFAIEGTLTDATAPTVTAFSPADGAVDVVVTDNLVVTFSEAVDVESGNVTIFTSDGTQVEVIDVTGGKITGSGSTEITINPANDLVAGSSYYIHIDATAFDDSAGNSYAGIADSTTWNFDAVPAPAASVTSSSSGGGTFLDVVQDGAGSVVLRAETSTAHVRGQVVSDTNVQVSSKIPDADQVQRVYMRVADRKIDLAAMSDGFTFITDKVAGLASGRYPYTLTADYGIFTLSNKGELIVTKQGSNMSQLISRQRDLFKQAFHRGSSEQEDDYWTDRVLDEDKKTEEELLGAMEWQALYGSERLVGTVRAVNSPVF